MPTDFRDSDADSFAGHVLFVYLMSILLAVLWGVAWYEIRREETDRIHEAEEIMRFQAQAFAENTRSTVKRLDDLLLDLREDWRGDWRGFRDTVQAHQRHIRDLAFQVGIIDAKGYLAFSNLAAPSERTDLSDREHFRVHRDRREDHLFISPPIQGRVSGKWTIQFTRPIYQKGRFAGVIVASVAPESLAAFHEALHLSPQGMSSILRGAGEILARQPVGELFLGKSATWPFGEGTPPLAGNFTRVSLLDGRERVHGYHRLPEYGLTMVVAEATEHLLEPAQRHRQTTLLFAGALTALLALMGWALHRARAGHDAAERLLRESARQQRLLGAAVAQSSASVVMTDTAGAIVFVNDAFTRTTGYDSAEVLGRNPRLLKSGLNDPAVYDDLWATIAANRPWHGELQNCKKNGEVFWESAVISPVTDESGVITHFIAVKDDITAKKQQETELRHAKEDAEAANLAKSQFLATMSHEIRTPMNGVLGMAQLLLQPGNSEAESEEYARIILSSGNTLLALLNDILDLSKVEAGKLSLSFSAFEPRQMLEEMMLLFGEPARRKGLRIEAEWLGPVETRYWADPIRLRQMLSNLISNAIKFTEKGLIHIEGRETTGKEGGVELIFAVTDSGIGIPADKQALLFQPFTQVDGSSQRRQGGTGLGLSIVRSLAELMGGEAGVESKAGQGTRFWFRVCAGHTGPDGAV